MNKIKTIFITNLIATLVFAFICGAFSYKEILHILPLVLGIFNILIGVVIMLIDNVELGKLFFLLGITGIVIGGSYFCGTNS
jgi:uncharacterized membrane protein HdeD (DUF308 family)